MFAYSSACTRKKWYRLQRRENAFLVCNYLRSQSALRDVISSLYHSLTPTSRHSFHPHPHPHCPLTSESCHSRCHSRLAPNSRLTRATSSTPHPWGCHLLTDSPWNSYRLMRTEVGAGLNCPPSCAVDLIPKRCRYLPLVHYSCCPSDLAVDDCRIRCRIVFCWNLLGFVRRECEGVTWLRNPWVRELVRRFWWSRIAILPSSSVVVADCDSRGWPVPVTVYNRR